MADAWAEFADFKNTKMDAGKVTSGDIFGTREYLKNNYLYRMAAAVLGIYGNSKAGSDVSGLLRRCRRAEAGRSPTGTPCASRRANCRRSTRSGR